jgi:Protein of unknown function (DUF3592)
VSFPEDQIAWMTNNRSAVLRYGRALQIITGLLFVALSYFMGKNQAHLLRVGVRTQGRIVGYLRHSFQRSGSTTSTSTGYMPIVEYRLEDHIVRFQDWLGAGTEGPTNIAVTVLYDAANPSVAMIDRRVWNWLPWAPILAVGLLLTIGGIIALLRAVN